MLNDPERHTVKTGNHREDVSSSAGFIFFTKCLGSEAQLQGCVAHRLDLTEKQGNSQRMFHPRRVYVFSESLVCETQLQGCVAHRLDLTEKQGNSQRMFHPRRVYVFSESLVCETQLQGV